MNTQAEATMDALKQFWIKAARFIEAMEDASAPMDSYVLALGKRVEKLEREVKRSRRAAVPASSQRRNSAVGHRLK